MTLLNKCIHHFNDDGAFTSLYLLSESHLSFHSWPENNYIALDVFTCGKCDTNKLLMDIVYFLQPKIVETNKIYRGNSNHNQDKTILTFNQESNLYDKTEDILNNNNIHNLICRSNKIIYEFNSEYQNIKIAENDKLGKCLFIDNILQISENDIEPYNVGLSEKMFDNFHNYGKMNNKILIIGGGDGFLVEHLLRNYEKVIDHITVVKLDEEVVHVVNKHFRNNINAFEHKKITLIHDFGDKYIKETKQTFDGIIIDCTDYDPNFPSAGLFNNDFYCDAIRKLNKNGYMTQQFGFIENIKQNNKYPIITAFNDNYNFECVNCLSYGLPINVLHYLLNLGGTPGSPLPPPRPSGNSSSLPFPMIRFLDEKLL